MIDISGTVLQQYQNLNDINNEIHIYETVYYINCAIEHESITIQRHATSDRPLSPPKIIS